MCCPLAVVCHDVVCYKQICYLQLDPRGVGALEGQTIEAATQQLQQGDMSSPRWRPPRGTDGTPNESSEDVLIRGRQVRRVQHGLGSPLSTQLCLPCSGCPQDYRRWIHHVRDLSARRSQASALVQVLSICETQWQYANVVIISPDSGETEIVQCKLPLRLCIGAPTRLIHPCRQPQHPPGCCQRGRPAPPP